MLLFLCERQLALVPKSYPSFSERIPLHNAIVRYMLCIYLMTVSGRRVAQILSLEDLIDPFLV